MTTMPILELSDRSGLASARRRGRIVERQPSASIDRLAVRLTNRLSRALRISVLGEYNSGKSALINVLIGTQVLPTSVEANTRLPVRIFQAARPSLADTRLRPRQSAGSRAFADQGRTRNFKPQAHDASRE